MKRGILAALAAAALTACGGGGGGVGQPFGNTGPIVDATGGTPVELTSAEVEAGLRARAAAADSLLSTDIFDLGGEPARPVSCSGAVCSSGGAEVSIRDLGLDAVYDSILTRNGVHIGQAAGSEFVAYGGWTDRGFFAFGFEESRQGGGVYGIAVGDSTGSVPISGSATWTGLMVGYEIARGEGHQGDATLTADFAAGTIDAVFTGIHDIETGAARSGFAFYNAPMTADGFASSVGGRIEGAFYGPEHAEAGGIFEYKNTVGAFGANRQ